MIDDDIRDLLRQGADRSLEGLEARIWVGVERQDAARRTGRLVTRCQTIVLIAALFGSAAAGAAAAASAHTSPQRITLGGSELAPSTLLLGHQR